MVSIRLVADQLDIVAQGNTIATHQRSFLRDQLICNPWHYLSVLEKKPGAIRHGAPFQNWELPEAIRRVREKLQRQDKNERAFVDLLLLTRKAGLDAFETACELALESGVVNASVLQNAIRRLTEPVRPRALNVSENLRLIIEPQADCQRYDYLLGSHHVTDLLTQLKALHLYGMAGAWSELRAEMPQRKQAQSPGIMLSQLINAEIADRQIRSLKYQLKIAKFPIHRDLVKFEWNETPLSRQQIEQLATAGFMDAAHNLILVGGTGTGKTHLATALGVAATHHGKRVRFFNAVDLVNQLEQEKISLNTTEPLFTP